MFKKLRKKITVKIMGYKYRLILQLLYPRVLRHPAVVDEVDLEKRLSKCDIIFRVWEKELLEAKGVKNKIAYLVKLDEYLDNAATWIPMKD